MAVQLALQSSSANLLENVSIQAVGNQRAGIGLKTTKLLSSYVMAPLTSTIATLVHQAKTHANQSMENQLQRGNLRASSTTTAHDIQVLREYF